MVYEDSLDPVLFISKNTRKTGSRMEVYVYVSVGVWTYRRMRLFLMKIMLLVVEKIHSAPLPHFLLSPKHIALRNLSLKIPAMPV